MNSLSHLLTASVLWSSAACLAAPTGNPELRLAPPLASVEIPVPPRQQEPWVPVSPGMSEKVVSATKILFQQGLADPRGCEYREIELGVGEPWTGGGTVSRTRGWVLPGVGGQRFAVAWNGLVYPVTEVGPAADLRKDAELVLASGVRYSPSVNVFEGSGVTVTNLLPIRVCLLARLGEYALAAKAWELLSKGDAGRYFQNQPTHDSPPGDPPAEPDPYLAMASDLAWSHFERAVTAHMREDVRLALASTRALKTLQPLVEAEAERRGFPKMTGYDSTRRNQPQPYLNFLDQLPALSADLERRARQEARKPVTQSELARLPDAAARIQALIRDLELVRVRQHSQPGMVNLVESSIVAALIKEGEAAVEPLLQCMERNDRLTQSVGFGRAFHRNRTVLTVKSAARAALRVILQADFEGGPAEIRAYWTQFKGATPEERWYRTLQDDSAGLARWLEAAGNIVLPENVVALHQKGWMPITDPSSTSLRMRGESLRANRSPTVAALMARRAETAHIQSTHDLHQACQLALHLAKWDPQAALPTLKLLSTRCRTQPRNQFMSPWPEQMLGQYLADLICERVRAGDMTALPEYADWLRAQSPQSLDDYVMASLRPLWENPDAPALRTVAEQMFNTLESPWSKLPWERTSFNDPVHSALVGVPAFQTLLLRQLTNRSPAGEWTYDPQQNNLRSDRMSSGGGFYYRRGQRPPAPVTAKMRECDVMAFHLSQLEGTPFFSIFAPEAEKQQAIESIRKFFAQYGERFRFDASLVDHLRAYGAPGTRLSFPALNRPATAADVAAGRAVFALDPASSPRVVPLVTRPLAAVWTTLREHAATFRAYGPEKGMHIIEKFAQDGYVWQAEESVTNGRTNLYYGFVGRFTIGRAAADEIEFPASPPWQQLTGRVDVAIALPPVSATEIFTGLPRSPLGKPLKITVRLRNRGPYTQSVTVAAGESASPAPLPGMLLRLERHRATGAPTLEATWRQLEDADGWQSVPMKKPTGQAGSFVRKPLAPAEATDALTANLSDWFSLKETGFYRLRVVFTPNGDSTFSGQAESFPFCVE